MKNFIHFNILLKRLIVLSVIVLSCSSTYAQTSKEYADTDVATLLTDIAAGTYDEYVLSTSGGVYDITYPSIPTSTTIKGKEGLAQKPIVQNSANTNGSEAIFRINGSSTPVTVTFENLEFNGIATNSPIMVRSDDESHIIVKNCYIHDAMNTNGVIRMNNAGSSLVVKNSLLKDCKQRIFYAYTTDARYGDIEIENSTFTNITGGDIVYFRSSGAYALGSNITINHCTFNNIGGNITRYDKGSMSGDINVTNSIFIDVTGNLKADLVDYNYTASMAIESTTATNSTATVPVFTDAANLNFALTNSNELIGSDLKILGDGSWYHDLMAPRVFDVLEMVDDTHLKLKYNEMVDATTAQNSSNYSLSGTAGFTGTPTEAVLDQNGTDVLLTVNDLSNIIFGQTVIVTVATATDLAGNVMTDNNIATYTPIDITAPIASISAQTVSNDAGSSLMAQSNEAGKLYLVMNGEPQTNLDEIKAIVEAGKGIAADVATKNTDVSLATSYLPVGVYSVYATDLAMNLSDISANSATIMDNTTPILSVVAQETTNSKIAVINAQSNEIAKIYFILDGESQSSVSDFETAITMKKGVVANSKPNENLALSAYDLVPGTYYAYAVDGAGNLSAKDNNAITVTQFVPRIRYYTASESGKLQDDLLAALDGDEFILTESGGEYKMAQWMKIQSAITIRAAEGLEQRPIFNNTVENSTFQTLRLFSAGASLTLKGIEFGGSSDPQYPVKYHIRVQEGIGSYYVIAENCYFRGTLKSGGAVVKAYNKTNADSMIFRNCIFENVETGFAMDGLSSSLGAGFSKIEISNCTFSNIAKSAFMVKLNPDLTQDKVNIDHCTFYKVGSSENAILIPNELNQLSVTNSIFANSEASPAFILDGSGTNKSMANNCTFFDVALPSSTNDGEIAASIYTFNPEFTDAANGDFTIQNQAIFALASDGLALGDLRWADVFGPEPKSTMTARSTSKLLLEFKEIVDPISAAIAANYTLSGTADLTGHVISAEPLNSYSVVLTVNDFASKLGKTIIVTVAGVKDLKGNAANQANTTSTYIVEEFRPVVTALEQNLTNASGNVALAQSNLDEGTVYIVLDGEAQTTVAEMDAAVTASKAAKATVNASFTDTEMNVFNLEPGTYYAYAIDANGAISDKGVAAIVLTDGVPPVVTAAMQSVENGANDHVLAQSNELGKIYILQDGVPHSTIAEMITATYKDNDGVLKGAKVTVSVINTDIEISTTDLEAGIYYAYAVDKKNNISLAGANPINITQITAINNKEENSTVVYSVANAIVVDNLNVENTKNITITDVMGRTIFNSSAFSNRLEFNSLKQGVYIINIYKTSGTIESSKVLVY